MKLKDVLKLIICGFEHSGTTMMIEFFKHLPNYDSGFETGFLLYDKPRQYFCDNTLQNPWIKFNMLKTGWKLNEEDFLSVSMSKNWPAAYDNLRKKSGFIENKEAYLIDKTPMYMKNLSDVSKRSEGIPIIAMVRDPRAIFYSWRKRNSEAKIDDFINHYTIYASSAKSALKRRKNIYLVQYEELCLNTEEVLKDLFAKLGYEFKKEYLNVNSKYQNVYGDSVSNKFLEEYKGYISAEEQNKILDSTKEWSHWFYNS